MVGFAGELGRSIGCQRCQTVSLHDAGVIFVSLCDQSAKHQFGESWTRTRAHGHLNRNRGLLADFAAAFNFASKNCEAGNLFQSFDQPHIRAALYDEEHTMPGRSFRQSGYCVGRDRCGSPILLAPLRPEWNQYGSSVRFRRDFYDPLRHVSPRIRSQLIGERARAFLPILQIIQTALDQLCKAIAVFAIRQQQRPHLFWIEFGNSCRCRDDGRHPATDRFLHVQSKSFIARWAHKDVCRRQNIVHALSKSENPHRLAEIRSQQFASASARASRLRPPPPEHGFRQGYATSSPTHATAFRGPLFSSHVSAPTNATTRSVG